MSLSYWTDAVHLLVKVRLANRPDAPHLRTSYIAKLVVDVYMACECALKSMIASGTRDKAGPDVYRVILRCGHDLRRLKKEAHPQGISDEDAEFLKLSSEMGVSLRYSLDLFSLTACELIPNDSQSLRIDQSFLSRFIDIAKLLEKEAEARHKEAFGDGVTSPMVPNQLKAYVECLRELSKKNVSCY